MLEFQTFFLNTFYFFIPVFFLLIFLISWFKEKRKISNGLLFNLFLMSFFAGLGTYALARQNALALFITIVLGVSIVFILLFGIYALIIFLFLNARKVWKKEGHALPNMLTLILAIVLTVFVIIDNLPYTYPSIIRGFILSSKLVLIYLSFVFVDYLTVNLLYQFNHPSLNQDYVITLGAGLIDGEKVTPLLASRVDKAISFFKKQQKKTQKPPMLIMSGGKGSDEKLSEAQAMKNYAMEQGIPEDYILLEDKSKNTLENMKFSKAIIEKRTPKYRAIFSSSNYHIFRASLFAKEAGLKANGIPSKTAFYYVPNAFLREFAAILVKHKKRHITVVVLIFLGLFFYSVLEWYLNKIGAIGPV